MTTYSNLTTGEEELEEIVLNGFDGYTFDPLQDSRSEFYARVLNGRVGGSAYSHLNTSEDRLLALLATDLGDTASVLQDSRSELLAKIATALSEGEGGGGELPEWVPENALVHIDLVRAFNSQDAAYVDGVGVVAVNTLLGTDSNADNYWGGSSVYDSEDLTADGLVPADIVAVIGAARTLLTTASGVSAVLRVTNAGSAGTGNFYISSASGNSAYNVSVQSNGAANVFADVSGANFDIGVTMDPFSDNSKVGFTIAQPSSTGAVCANGSAADTDTIAAEDWPGSGEEFVAVAYVMSDPEDPIALAGLTIYAPVNAAALSALTA